MLRVHRDVGSAAEVTESEFDAGVKYAVNLALEGDHRIVASVVAHVKEADAIVADGRQQLSIRET